MQVENYKNFMINYVKIYCRCLRYMSEYTNCLLQGYGVLPSAPTKLHITNIDIDYAIIHWSLPKTLSDTVKYYNLHYRMMTTYDNDYKTIQNVHPPYILENLQSNTDYEVFVEAVNGHGISEPSTRVIFRTQSKVNLLATIHTFIYINLNNRLHQNCLIL